MNGRNFEYFGEDPYLGSAIAVGYITGVQHEGVSATVKHFLGNNSEYLRHDTDSIIEERALREIYMPTFESAVKQAHVGAIMDSYNLTNGEHMTQNRPLNVEVAKGEWHFPGLIMSDWVSVYDSVGAFNGGLDLEMPFGVYFDREKRPAAAQERRYHGSNTRRQGAPHPWDCGALWLARPRAEGPHDPALQPAGARCFAPGCA